MTKQVKEFDILVHDARNLLANLQLCSMRLMQAPSSLSPKQLTVIGSEIESFVFDIDSIFSDKYEKKKRIYINKRLKEIAQGYCSLDIRTNYDRVGHIYLKQTYFDRIFSNIIKNANEAPPSENPKKIEVTTLKKSDSIEVTITNNGKKIPDNIIKNIFTKGVTTKKTSGIGLYSVKKLVDRLDGRIKVESDNNETKFIVSLPLKTKRA